MFLFQVFLVNTDELINSLCLFQYPLRPTERPFGDQGKLSSIQINNNANEFSLKFNYNIDSKSKYYDNSLENKVFKNNIEF